ncbi:MAG: alpha/beta hydrolase [Bacteroidota bacterium]
MKKSIILFTVSLISLFTISLYGQNEPFKVRVVGAGEPLLFFPGFACTDEVWEEQVAILSKDYECHLFTFAGFGGVPSVEFPWYPKIEKEILDYIKKNQLENSIAIGHSLGGTLALSLAAKNDIFKKLVIVDALTATGALMFPNFSSDNMVYDSPYNNQVLAMNPEAFEKMASNMAFGMTKNKEKQGQIIEWMKGADRETYVYGYTDYLKVDLREEVANINIPVLILAATEPFGLDMAKKTYEDQYKNLSDYELKFAEGSSHFIMYDKPEWLLNQLQSSLY